MTSIYQKKIETLEEKVNSMSTDYALLNQIVKSFSDSLKKFSETLEKLDITLSTVEKSLISMQGEINKNTVDVGELKDKVDRLDSDHKFNWSQFVNNRLIPLLLGGGTVWGITEIIKNLSK